MKNNAFKTLIFALLVLVSGSSLWAQDKYVVSAQFHISINQHELPDVYINHHQIISSNSDALLFAPKINITKDFTADQLCYFSNDNSIGIDVEQILGDVGDTDAEVNTTIGMAFVLKIVFSDNTTLNITSDEGMAKQLYLKKGASEPGGWANTDFEDGSWTDVNPFAPISKSGIIVNPQTNLAVKFFPTYILNNALKSLLGDKIYFRRKFSMEVTTPPGCVPERKPPPKFTPTPKNPTPTATSLPPTATPRPTRTPRPRATATDTFTPRPTWTRVPPRPTATPRAAWTPKPPRPTSTPLPGWTEPPLPTATPRPPHKPKPTRTPRLVRPTATPEIYVPQNTATEPPLPTKTRTPTLRRKKPTATPTLEAMATATFTEVLPQDTGGMAATIVFVNPPVNIDASFADGPGRYKLEIVDAQGGHINTLYDKHVGFEKETWISWDGTNDQGQLMHYGQYYAFFTKDGKLIQKIALTWIPPNQSANP